MNCISSLLDVDGSRRLSASDCLEHQWLTGSYLDTLKQLETTWMRKYLAKRRWQRWFNTVKAMNRMQRLVKDSGGGNGASADAVDEPELNAFGMAQFVGGGQTPQRGGSNEDDDAAGGGGGEAGHAALERTSSKERWV